MQIRHADMIEVAGLKIVKNFQVVARKTIDVKD